MTRRGARQRKGVEAGTAEKKISILERALEHHAGSEDLLLALLEVVSPPPPPSPGRRRGVPYNLRLLHT